MLYCLLELSTPRKSRLLETEADCMHERSAPGARREKARAAPRLPPALSRPRSSKVPARVGPPGPERGGGRAAAVPGLAARGRCRLRTSPAKRFIRHPADPDPRHPGTHPRPASRAGAFRSRELRAHFGALAGPTPRRDRDRTGGAGARGRAPLGDGGARWERRESCLTPLHGAPRALAWSRAVYPKDGSLAKPDSRG